MNTKIKALIFDVGGVLQLEEGNKKGVHGEMIKKLRLPTDSYFDAIDSTFTKSIEGTNSSKEVVKILSENLKISPKKLVRYYKKAIKKNFKLNKELLIFAQKVKKNNIKVTILSDMWHLSKEVLIIKKFYKIFDPVIISCDVGIRKPNPKIYKLIIKKLKINPKEAVFIDNREWNLVPAKKLGIKTILFKNNKQTILELEKLLV